MLTGVTSGTPGVCRARVPTPNVVREACCTLLGMQGGLQGRGGSTALRLPQQSSEAWTVTTVSDRLQPEPGAREGTASVPSPCMPGRPSPPGIWRSHLWADGGHGSHPGMESSIFPQAPSGPQELRPSTLGLRLGGHGGHTSHTHVPPPTGVTPAPHLTGQAGEDRAC